MKCEYICHACLAIDTDDLKIVTDPWFQGPAYCGQWNVFPKPVSATLLGDRQVILLSHGHEDHFHIPTLQTLPKTARVLYPYTWFGGVQSCLADLGFHDVVEAVTHKTIRLSPGTSVTYVVNNLDSIIVIESQGQVFVNVNDALHPYPPKIADTFVQYIRQRWPRIDTVFCGFGAASYFPNMVHCPGKNDLEIAESREQLFLQAFCTIVHGLHPKVAVPFAADFALLRPNQKWTNAVRFPRSRFADYYREIYGQEADAPRIQEMYSGDVLVDSELIPSSPYREQLRMGSLNHLIDEQYRAEISAIEKETWVTEADAQSLEQEVLENLRSRASCFDRAALRNIEFSLMVPDVRENPYFNISMKSAEPRVERSAAPSPDAILKIVISSNILRYSFASEWGGDAITIGYGCEIFVFQAETVEAGLDTICVQLLTRTPAASRHWKAEPLRMARYIMSSPINRQWAAKGAANRLRGKQAFSNDYDDKTRAWLVRTKCESCGACDLPVLDEKFSQTL